MSTVTEPRVDLDALPEGDPFYYGWRDVYHCRQDGSSYCEQIPLTLRDFLHPQEGDHFVENDVQFLARKYLYDVFDSRLGNRPDALVFSDLAIYWDITELGHHSPDVSVILGIRKRKNLYPSFDVAEEGVRPRLIVEVVSPRTRDVDVGEKYEAYHQLEIPFYIILDRQHEEDPWDLKGYQYTPAAYLPMPKDKRGWLWLDPVGVWLHTLGQTVICYDAKTENKILGYKDLNNKTDKLQVAVEEERKLRLTAEAELVQLRAELARLKQSQPPQGTDS